MVVPEQKDAILTAVRRWKGWLAELEEKHEKAADDAPDLRGLIEAEIERCNAGLDRILREERSSIR
jgi:hypothetical protein